MIKEATVAILAQTHLVTSGTEKSYWEANQALPVLRTIDRDGAHRAIDGERSLGSPLYHSINYEGQNGHAWVQIKLDREHWVKGGVITSRETWPNRQQYKEVVTMHYYLN